MSSNSTHYFITGAAGALGRLLIERLLLRDPEASITALEHHSPVIVPDQYQHRVRIVHGDISRIEETAGLLSGVDVLVHAAATTHTDNNALYDAVNAHATAALLAAAKNRGIKHFIYISTTALGPLCGPYGASKLTAEESVKSSGVPYTIIRFSEVYGAKSKEGIERLIKLVRSLPLLPYLPNAFVTPLHSDDAMDALLRAIEAKPANNTYVIAGPTTLSLKHAMEVIANVFQKRRLFIPVPLFLLSPFIHSKLFVAAGDQVERLLCKKDYDISATQQDLSFAPRSFEQGLAEYQKKEFPLVSSQQGRLRSIVQNSLLVLASIVVALGLLEVAVRIFVPEVLTNQDIRTYDPQLSYKFLPNLDTSINSGTGARHVITNSYGYIGENFEIKKPAGEYRIANIGDSYVEGVQEVDWDGTFSHLLGVELSKRTSDWTFRSMNFGFSGRGQIEEYWVYKYFVRKITPDLTILWITQANDLGNNYLPSGPPTASNSNTFGTIKYYIKKSALATLLFQRMKSNPIALEIFSTLRLTNAKYDPIEKGMPGIEEMINYSTNPREQVIQEKSYQTTSELLRSLSDDVRADGGKLLVVIIPVFTDKDAFARQFFLDYPNAKTTEFDFTKPNTFFTTTLRALNIDFLDLTPNLKAYEEGASSLKDCGTLWGDHFTPCGHKITSEIVSKYVYERYIKQN